MKGRLFVAVVLLGVGVLATGAKGELPRAWKKPCFLPGIPQGTYSAVPANPHPTTTVVSLARVSAGRLTPLPPGPSPRPPQLYQLSQARLQVDHCFLTRVGVTLHADGAYQISFRADQNPEPSKDPASPLRQGERGQGDLWTLQTKQLLRNEFEVKVRGYAGTLQSSSPPNAAATKPAVIEFPVERFWVQRSQPYAGFVTGQREDVRKYFEYIDRVEVEFTYR
jgi:hypothetical protein